jgi:beta-lactam-binding protein with PASTA domain
MTPSEEWPARPSDTAVVARNGAIATEQETIYEPVQPPLPPEEPDAALGRGMLLGLVVLALAAVGALAAWYLTQRDDTKAQTTTVVRTAPAAAGASGGAQNVSVPVLVGLTEQDAVIKLGKTGLRPEIERRTSGPRDGLVVSQRPAGAAFVAAGAPITILVDRPKAATSPKPAAAAPKPQPEPKPAPAAAATTTAAETAPTPTTTAAAQTTQAAPAPKPAPQPAPQAAPTDSTVPDVAGQDEQAAAQALNQAGIFTSIVFVPAESPLGTVEAQAKPSGTELAPKSTVQINVSRGPGEKPDQTVPDLTGQRIPDAVTAVQSANLRLIMVKADVPTREQAGLVVKQSPMPGAKAPQNAQVLVYMGACTTCK